MMTFAQNPREVANQNKLARRMQRWAEAVLPPSYAGSPVTIMVEDDETFIVVLGPQTKRLRIAAHVRVIAQEEVNSVMKAWRDELEADPKEAAEESGEDPVAGLEALAIAGEPAPADSSACAATATAADDSSRTGASSS